MDEETQAIINETAPQAEPAQEAAPAQAPQFKEYEFNTGGQAVKIRDNDPRFQQWLSQGHSYAQNISQLKAERDQWNKQKQEWESQWGRYKEIDQFAQQNPDWWAKVDQSFQTKDQPQIPDEVRSYLEPIVKDYGMVKDFVQSYQQEKIQEQMRAQDSALEQEIKSIQGKYQNLDFNSKDAQGLTLEQQVLKHAQETGIPTFKAAFLDYYHEHLEKLAEARGKESVTKEMQQRKKLGLLGESPTPSKGLQQLENGHAKSWGDVHLEALRELNLA